MKGTPVGAGVGQAEHPGSSVVGSSAPSAKSIRYITPGARSSGGGGCPIRQAKTGRSSTPLRVSVFYQDNGTQDGAGVPPTSWSSSTSGSPARAAARDRRRWTSVQNQPFGSPIGEIYDLEVYPRRRPGRPTHRRTPRRGERERRRQRPSRGPTGPSGARTPQRSGGNAAPGERPARPEARFPQNRPVQPPLPVSCVLERSVPLTPGNTAVSSPDGPISGFP